MKPELDIRHLETFVFDYERLRQLDFDKSEYDIQQGGVLLRKFLIDSGLHLFWNHFFSERLDVFSLKSNETFEDTFLKQIKLHIPILNVLPIVYISNYFSIRAQYFSDKASKREVKYPEITLRKVNIDKYLNESYIVVDSDSVSRRDIIEYVCYGIGAVHYGIKKEKIDRIKAVKKKNFQYAQGDKQPDALFSWMVSFITPELEQRFKDDPNFAKFLMTLGEKHSFESLLILQMAHDIASSDCVRQLYQSAKEHLITHSAKFRNYTAGQILSELK
jgi:hypothetical protein